MYNPLATIPTEAPAHRGGFADSHDIFSFHFILLHLAHRLVNYPRTLVSKPSLADVAARTQTSLTLCSRPLETLPGTQETQFCQIPLLPLWRTRPNPMAHTHAWFPFPLVWSVRHSPVAVAVERLRTHGCSRLPKSLGRQPSPCTCRTAFSEIVPLPHQRLNGRAGGRAMGFTASAAAEF